MIFNENEEWTVTDDEIASKSHNTPFIGTKLFGRVKYNDLRRKDCIRIKNIQQSSWHRADKTQRIRLGLGAGSAAVFSNAGGGKAENCEK